VFLHVPSDLNDDFHLFISVCNFLIIYAFILITCMTIVLGIVHPVQLLKQKVSKTGCFHLSVRVHFFRGPKKSRKLSLRLMKETDPLL